MESSTACDLQPEPEVPAEPSQMSQDTRDCPEQDLQQSLQHHQFRKQTQNAARKAARSLNLPILPTTQCLVTRNFSPAITSY